MFVNKQFAAEQVGIELGDVSLGFGDIRGAAEVVGVEVEDVLVRVLGFGRRTLHRGHSRWRAQLAVVVFALFFYLHHTHLVVFLPGRDDVCAMSVGVLEYARTDFGGHAPVADEIVLGETLPRNAEYGRGVDGEAIHTARPSEPFGFFGAFGAFGVITLEMPSILSTGSYLYCVCMMLSPLAVSSMPCNRSRWRS